MSKLGSSRPLPSRPLRSRVRSQARPRKAEVDLDPPPPLPSDQYEVLAALHRTLRADEWRAAVSVLDRA